MKILVILIIAFEIFSINNFNLQNRSFIKATFNLRLQSSFIDAQADVLMGFKLYRVDRY